MIEGVRENDTPIWRRVGLWQRWTATVYTPSPLTIPPLGWKEGLSPMRIKTNVLVRSAKGRERNSSLLPDKERLRAIELHTAAKRVTLSHPKTGDAKYSALNLNPKRRANRLSVVHHLNSNLCFPWNHKNMEKIVRTEFHFKVYVVVLHTTRLIWFLVRLSSKSVKYSKLFSFRFYKNHL